MNSDAFVNRELSWLEFNRRVLEEAQDPSVPLLERVKFLAIFSSNLDEFFMVRVAALKRRIHSGDQMPGPDGLTPAETTKAVSARVRALVEAQRRCFLGEIEPLLTAEGILLLSIYTGYDVRASHTIRVTRDADLHARGGPEDLLASIEEGVRERRLGTAVRLQYDADLPSEILATLLDELELSSEDLYEGDGFTAFSDLFQLYAALDVPRLKDRPLPPQPVPAFEGAFDIWTAIRAGDVLVHHPYHAFDAVTRFVREAAVDPKVLAIKMTLYRVSPASPIAHALRTAVENGKEVTVLVELQARFDEEANIRWARTLAEVGAHVVYGRAGLKIHCKACLVARQETDGLRRYCHLATGNYNVRTGGVYGDLGIFTCRDSFGEDLTALFNLLTGYTRPRGFHHLLLAPTDLRDGLVQRIRREAAHARAGRPARIIAKMNGLVDRRLIEELYRASEAGVRIDLIVRGMCCLRPGVAGLSSRIRVISIVDRYLEHARISYFENGEDAEYLLASADWMPRNLDRRVEIAFPVLDPHLQTQVREILEIQLADTEKARRILPDGSSVRIRGRAESRLRSQERLYEATATKGIVR